MGVCNWLWVRVTLWRQCRGDSECPRGLLALVFLKDTEGIVEAVADHKLMHSHRPQSFISCGLRDDSFGLTSGP